MEQPGGSMHSQGFSNNSYPEPNAYFSLPWPFQIINNTIPLTENREKMSLEAALILKITTL